MWYKEYIVGVEVIFYYDFLHLNKLLQTGSRKEYYPINTYYVHMHIRHTYYFVLKVHVDLQIYWEKMQSYIFGPY